MTRFSFYDHDATQSECAHRLIEASGKNSSGAPTVLCMRDIFRTLHVRVRDPFEGHRFSVNI